MNHTFTKRYLETAIGESLKRRLSMLNEAGGETLDALMEAEYIRFLHEMKMKIAQDKTDKIVLTLRDVFIAGYRASEERNWK
jgi:hypothetical protein